MPKGVKKGGNKGKGKAKVEKAETTAPPPPPPTRPNVPEILADDEAIVTVKEKSRNKYLKVWLDFREFYPSVEHEFDARMPYERELHYYFLNLRQSEKKASSTLWTIYSMLNTVIKAKYGVSLKSIPRISALLKSFDTDTKKKASVFTMEELKQFCSDPNLEGPYWEARKAIAIVAYFGGLRLTEIMSLELERFTITPSGILVSHSRAKQRSDKRESKFCVPASEDFNWASLLAGYLNKIATELEQFTGRVWWTGRKEGHYIKIPMGKNMVASVPNLIASYLGKADPTRYSFHSFRRSSATAAADGGSTPQQMMDFFGWSNSNMPNEYISTSNAQVSNMAMKLASGNEFAGPRATNGPPPALNGPPPALNGPPQAAKGPDTASPAPLPSKAKSNRSCKTVETPKLSINDSPSSTSSEETNHWAKGKNIIIIKNVSSLKM